MSIKKSLKKEKKLRKIEIAISIFLMIFMAYFVIVLNSKGILIGFDSYFSYAYVLLITILLLFNISRIVSDEKISYEVEGEKLKIDGGLFLPSYVIPLKKIIYVDVYSVSKKEFNVLIVTERTSRRKYSNYNRVFVNKNPHYSEGLKYIESNYNEDDKFSCIQIKKGGARKYYLLYVLYKSAHNIEFSKNAVGYISEFVKEYRL